MENHLKMEVCALPISGGRFPCQLGLIHELSKNNYRPDVSFGSSGGNVNAYLAAAADWRPNGILRISKSVTSDLFCQSWFPQALRGFLPSYLIGVFYGSAYSDGIGVDELFETLFTNASIGNYEIWTGTVNRNKGKAEFFCNLDSGSSRLSNHDFCDRTYGCLPRVYLDRDIKAISKISQASASIPLIVPDKTFRENTYQDGGLFFASPLTPFISTLARRKEKIHITYINSLDLDDLGMEEEPSTSIFGKSGSAMSGLLKSTIIHDRNNGINFVKSHGEVHYMEGDNLKEILKVKNDYSRTMLELYPKEKLCLKIEGFEHKEINDIMMSTKESYGYRFWGV